MLRNIRWFSLVLMIVGCFLVPITASAHEQRDVGPYQFTVGFMNEPAFAGEQNGIWLKIADKATGQPVENAADTIQAVVMKGAASRPMELQPAFGEKGIYTAVFYPMEAGDYTFHFSGNLGGTPIDETFTSSPDGFHAVSAATELQFPSSVPAPAELTAQLAASKQTARTALILAGVGLGIGLLSMLGLIVLAVRSRRAGSALAESSAARS